MAEPSPFNYRNIVRRQQGRGERKIDDDSLAKAIYRLDQTADGQRFLSWIFDQTRMRHSDEDAEEGALRGKVALNNFAARIFNLLAKGRNEHEQHSRSGDKRI